jgi:SAM-dependent methyltransferase
MEMALNRFDRLLQDKKHQQRKRQLAFAGEILRPHTMPGKEIWSAQFNPQRFNELDEVLRQLERRGLHPQINGYTSQLVQGKSFNNNTLCMDVSQIQWQWGRAVGVDLWRKVDQSGNSAEATQRNALAEGVADRIELHTGDLRALPFEDNGFDVVLSNFAIHNISGRAGREKAISEAVRVLRPGGRLLIVDVRATRQYQAQLARLGMHDVARRGLGWWFQPARLVTATKPQPGH